MINVASTPKPSQATKIGDDCIFTRYETVKYADIQSSILLTHLAGNFLTPNGFVGFNGGSPEIISGSDK